MEYKGRGAVYRYRYSRDCPAATATPARAGTPVLQIKINVAKLRARSKLLKLFVQLYLS